MANRVDKTQVGVLMSVCQGVTWGYATKILQQLDCSDPRILKIFGIWYCAENFVTRGYKTERGSRDPQAPFGGSVLKWWTDFEAWLRDSGGLQHVILMYTERHGQAFSEYMEINNPPDEFAKRIMDNAQYQYTTKKQKQIRTERIQNLWDGVE